MELARRGVELADQSDMLNTRARVWLALVEVLRVDGNGLEADAAMGEAIRLYEQKGNITAAAAAALVARAGGVSETV